MSHRFSYTMTDQQKEDKEVERTVRPMPKKKPPRYDSQRDRMEVEDKDTKSDDEDLSLNYKDVGGSLERIAKAPAKTPYKIYAPSDKAGRTSYRVYTETGEGRSFDTEEEAKAFIAEAKPKEDISKAEETKAEDPKSEETTAPKETPKKPSVRPPKPTADELAAQSEQSYLPPNLNMTQAMEGAELSSKAWTKTVRYYESLSPENQERALAQLSNDRQAIVDDAPYSTDQAEAFADELEAALRYAMDRTEPLGSPEKLVEALFGEGASKDLAGKGEALSLPKSFLRDVRKANLLNVRAQLKVLQGLDSSYEKGSVGANTLQAAQEVLRSRILDTTAGADEDLRRTLKRLKITTEDPQELQKTLKSLKDTQLIKAVSKSPALLGLSGVENAEATAMQPGDRDRLISFLVESFSTVKTLRSFVPDGVISKETLQGLQDGPKSARAKRLWKSYRRQYPSWEDFFDQLITGGVRAMRQASLHHHPIPDAPTYPPVERRLGWDDYLLLLQSALTQYGILRLQDLQDLFPEEEILGMALNMAIYSSSWQNRIDAPTFHKLLEILMRALEDASAV